MFFYLQTPYSYDSVNTVVLIDMSPPAVFSIATVCVNQGSQNEQAVMLFS